jgi:magnesium transporter
MTDREIGEMLEELYTDDAVDMLEEMPANVVKRIMKNATPETREEINRFLAYPEESAGSVMTSEFIDLRKNMTCAEAITRIRRIGLDKETVYVAYVTDQKRVLEGVVVLKQLLFAHPDELIGDIMNENVLYASTHDDREKVANMISHYGIIALPIVDKEKRLVGLVTVDDALEVIETEATEDIEKMAAIIPTDKPYFKVGIFETYRKRMPWLLLLMISATFTGAIITSYENALASYVVLTAYIPMLMDTGGNAGSQASVSIIRGLSLGEVEFEDIFKAIWKEIRVAILCGLTLAATNFVKLLLLDHLELKIAGIVCITLVLVVTFAKLVGCSLPLIAAKIGFDPAVMASPLITTIVDAISLSIYFALATNILHIVT